MANCGQRRPRPCVESKFDQFVGNPNLEPSASSGVQEGAREQEFWDIFWRSGGEIMGLLPGLEMQVAGSYLPGKGPQNNPKHTPSNMPNQL